LKHRLGVSGSTILSNPKKYHELLWEGIEHIEIGEFLDDTALESFLKLCQEHQLTFGIHSPLYRCCCAGDRCTIIITGTCLNIGVSMGGEGCNESR
jgi:hypothetical protein